MPYNYCNEKSMSATESYCIRIDLKKIFFLPNFSHSKLRLLYV